ncbi:hypothetical protein [Enterobacter kobei]|uniref:hypothetical protein n=1 Tax=Enterobacter kobei TaxID=208224 RepID=UPI0021BE837D|nr:hypothetical protein [Enterobacter kobei]MCU6339078.1 hypothetical protein [Enterobacter quasiroggenkampii]UXJ66680.1 hypothetical protein N5P26_22680 [Enterobacter kobei]HCR0386880.1 hypothetical protein [Enterobacter kobei]
MKMLITLFCLLIGSFTYAQCPVAPINSPNEESRKLSVNKLSEFMICDISAPENDRSPCNTFASQGLNAIWGINDFGSDQKTYLTANQIWEKVNSPDTVWHNLGSVLNEDNNLCAQSLANAGWAVLAVMKGSDNGHGHIALIIPGEPQQALSWGMLVANSASFFLDKPYKAYISKPLSFAFSAANANQASFFYRGR